MSSRKGRAKRERRRLEAEFGADFAAKSGRTAVAAAIASFPSATAPVASKPAPSYAQPVAPKPVSPIIVPPKMAPPPTPVYVTPAAPKPPGPSSTGLAHRRGKVDSPGPGLVKLPPTSEASYIPPSPAGPVYREPESEVYQAEIVEPIVTSSSKETPKESLPSAVPKQEQRAPLGLWARMGQGLANVILSIFGIKKSVSIISGEPPLSRFEAAGSLVRRARNGDQNAMAIIDMTRQNAAAGNVQAKLGQACILDYIKKHPVTDDGMAGEVNPLTTTRDRDYSLAHSVQIADGPLLSNPRIRFAIENSAMTNYEKQAFVSALTSANEMMPVDDVRSPHQKALRAGRTMGLARRWQGLRTREIPLRAVDEMIAWEMGE